LSGRSGHGQKNAFQEDNGHGWGEKFAKNRRKERLHKVGKRGEIASFFLLRLKTNWTRRGKQKSRDSKTSKAIGKS